MSSMIVKPPDDELAYDQIEAAVMETGRGRWFLAEYARRNRHAETETVLQAIDKLQRSLGLRSGAFMLPVDKLQAQILEMARAIAQTERDIRAIQPDGAATSQYTSASNELSAVVDTTETATSSILSAAEKVQEYAWTMRERSGNEDACDLLDSCATEIYTACSFQDVTAQRIRKVVETLGFIDGRIKSILEATGLAEDFQADEQMIGELDAPKAAGVRTSDIWMSEEGQAEIDDTFDFFVPAEVAEPTMIGAELMDLGPEMPPKATRAAPKPAVGDMPHLVASAPEPVDIPTASSPYDGLSTEEKIRAFR
jgi:chemotaxis regulatin CheY-phosphate phosphatase CheZ